MNFELIIEFLFVRMVNIQKVLITHLTVIMHYLGALIKIEF